jgi:hypothetical protein
MFIFTIHASDPETHLQPIIRTLYAAGLMKALRIELRSAAEP